ncbi:aldo/keto reductase [bacterium]|nr:aldo/keto reductase [bacterium]
MIYRQLGRTGYRVSQLGFGCMRLPMTGDGPEAQIDRELAIPMLHRAFEAGVNYVDSAVGYCNGDSQRVLGEALVGWRDRIVVSTKNHDYGTDEKVWWQNLEDSLERLRVESIDLYCHHFISWKSYVEAVEPRLSKWMHQALDQKLIKHICVSFHDNAEALKKLILTGYPEVITLQYNMLYRELEDGIALAQERGIGVVVMGPVGGGRLGSGSDVLLKLLPQVKRVPELALRFVLANPNVSVALSGMSAMAHVEENLATATDGVSLTPADQAAMDEQLARLKGLADLYCTGCRYCLPCPKNVAIPDVFGEYNNARVYDLTEHARTVYKTFLARQQGADMCAECGECLEKCPQRIDIPRQLADAHQHLA